MEQKKYLGKTMSMNRLYKKLILKYGVNPYNFHYTNDNTHIGKGYNQFCGDQINLYVKMRDDKIDDMSFLGKSCAISTASTSLMIKTIKNKSLYDIKKIYFIFSNMFTSNKLNLNLDNDCFILRNLLYVKKYPSRIKCVTLSWNIMYNMLLKKHII
jgi:nitrogen fixation NifU-like protein